EPTSDEEPTTDDEPTPDEERIADEEPTPDEIPLSADPPAAGRVVLENLATSAVAISTWQPSWPNGATRDQYTWVSRSSAGMQMTRPAPTATAHDTRENRHSARTSRASPSTSGSAVQ